MSLDVRSPYSGPHHNYIHPRGFPVTTPQWRPALHPLPRAAPPPPLPLLLPCRCCSIRAQDAEVLLRDVQVMGHTCRSVKARLEGEARMIVGRC